MKALAVIGLSLFFFSCQEEVQNSATSAFENDLRQLQDYFRIPGMAALVNSKGEIVYEQYFGYADLDNQQKIDQNTIFPIASVTKTFATIVLLQLVDSGKVSLDDPMSAYVDQDLPADVRVKHILSHTSEGVPGEFFNYSYRFSWLTKVIEKAGGNSLATQLQDRIISPLGLSNTVPLLDQLTVESIIDRMASPYLFTGEIENGYYDPGLSAASGLSSSLGDLARFDDALDNNSLIPAELKESMFAPTINSSQDTLEYGQGLFSQQFGGLQLVWGYGQSDCFSSLLLKVPERELTLILLANSNLMSDPPRLINGDITYSLFALSFLNHYVFGNDSEGSVADFDQSLQVEQDALSNLDPTKVDLLRQQVLAQALAASFMGFADTTQLQVSRELTKVGLKLFPDYLDYGNSSLMRLFTVLSAFADYSEFDQATYQLGTRLVSTNRYDPYANVYLGFLHQARSQPDKAATYYRNILEAPNLSPFWYTHEANRFFEELPE